MQAHIEQARKSGAKVKGALLPDFPKGMEYIWSAYSELHTGAVLTISDFAAYNDVAGVKLSYNERSTLRRLSCKFLEVSHGE